MSAAQRNALASSCEYLLMPNMTTVFTEHIQADSVTFVIMKDAPTFRKVRFDFVIALGLIVSIEAFMREDVRKLRTTVSVSGIAITKTCDVEDSPYRFVNAASSAPEEKLSAAAPYYKLTLIFILTECKDDIFKMTNRFLRLT